MQCTKCTQNFGTHIIAEWVQIGIFPHCEASTGAKMLISNFEYGQNSVSVQECSSIGQMSADTLYLEQFISYATLCTHEPNNCTLLYTCTTHFYCRT